MARLSLALLAALLLGACAQTPDEPAGAPNLEPPSPDSAAPQPGAEPPDPTPDETAAAPAPPEPPSPPADPLPTWWAEQPVRTADTVSVCAEATDPDLRQARAAAIRLAYDRLGAEIGADPVSAEIADYDAAHIDGGRLWRFRVRISGAAPRNPESR